MCIDTEAIKKSQHITNVCGNFSGLHLLPPLGVSMGESACRHADSGSILQSNAAHRIGALPALGRILVQLAVARFTIQNLNRHPDCNTNIPYTIASQIN